MGTAYACLRPIERYPSSGTHAHSQEVLGLRMFPYAFLLRKLKLYFYNSQNKNTGNAFMHIPVFRIVQFEI